MLKVTRDELPMEYGASCVEMSKKTSEVSTLKFIYSKFADIPFDLQTATEMLMMSSSFFFAFSNHTEPFFGIWRVSKQHGSKALLFAEILTPCPLDQARNVISNFPQTLYTLPAND